MQFHAVTFCNSIIFSSAESIVDSITNQMVHVISKVFSEAIPLRTCCRWPPKNITMSVRRNQGSKVEEAYVRKKSKVTRCAANRTSLMSLRSQYQHGILEMENFDCSPDPGGMGQRICCTCDFTRSEEECIIHFFLIDVADTMVLLTEWIKLFGVILD